MTVERYMEEINFCCPVLSENQKSQLRDWMEGRERPSIKNATAGNRYSITLTPTGMGLIVIVTDSVDEGVIDISDYDLW